MIITHGYLNNFIENIPDDGTGDFVGAKYIHINLTLSVDAISDLVSEYNDLERRGYDAEQTAEVAEKMRPMWAQGYTNDSMAAQASSSALTSIWELLGANNQTEAMEKLEAAMHLYNSEYN